MDRFVRQSTLAAVGDAGQARIGAASYSSGPEGSLPAVVEHEYLTRAGAERFGAASPETRSFAHAEAFRHQVARDFAEGAWRALDQLQRALVEP